MLPQKVFFIFFKILLHLVPAAPKLLPMKWLLLLICIPFFLITASSAYSMNDSTLVIKKTEDFKITGEGNASAWQQTDWVNIPQRQGPDNGWKTQAKALYSDKGVYFLMQCQDQTLTVTLKEDFANLYNEDVVEVFLWTDEKHPVYFEYEISPLNYELPIMVPHLESGAMGWLPWHYEGERRTIHATSTQGGKKKSGASVSGWMAEFFIPFALLKPLGNVPPEKGTAWRINLYRIDYDKGEYKTWQWQPTSGSFHEYQRYGTTIFD